MRLKEYGRNANKRKEYVSQPDLRLVGVDVSTATHKACLGTQTTMRCRTLEFTHTHGQKRDAAYPQRHGTVWYLLAGPLRTAQQLWLGGLPGALPSRTE